MTTKKAKCKRFVILHDHDGICDFLTKTGPERFIAMTTEEHRGDYQHVFIWYWEKTPLNDSTPLEDSTADFVEQGIQDILERWEQNHDN